MIENSIVMTHYCEDPEREKIALRCIEALQSYRNKTTEFILVCNGHYKGLEKYADQYFERDVDTSPGRSTNIGFKAAKGDVLVTLCNDVLLYGNWLEECRKIVTKYDKYTATPIYPLFRQRYELPMVDGYFVNQRVGADCMVFHRKQYEDIGTADEVDPMYDGSNYLNRMIAKGYAVMMTPERLGTNLGLGVHSYLKQQKELGYKRMRNVKISKERNEELERIHNEKVERLNESRNDLAKRFMGVGVEVGVERGKFSEIICQNSDIKLYAIDAWQAYAGYKDHTRQDKLDRFYEETKKRLDLYNCEVIKKFSMDAVKDFADESLDFVYIDANHDYKHVMNDITEWAKKVKSGGIISGHDYLKKDDLVFFDLVTAVNDYVRNRNIPKLTIYEGDEYPSWSFIKP